MNYFVLISFYFYL